MQEGKVKFFNETKGFGFINDLQSGKDVFVHSSGLIHNIFENDTVNFDLVDGPKGLSAINVKVI